MKSVDEIYESVDKQLEAIENAKRVLGSECFTGEADARISALYEIRSLCVFAKDRDELVKWINESGVKEDVKKQMKTYRLDA